MMSRLVTLAVGVAGLALLLALGTVARAEDERPASPGEFVDQSDDYEEEEQDVIEYKDGRLTADVVDVSLRQLLTEIGRQSGAKVRLEGDDQTVTDLFKSLPLDNALRRVVSNRNFSIIYGEQRNADGKVVGSRLKEIHVFPPGQAAPPARPVVRPVAQREKRQNTAAKRSAVTRGSKPNEPRANQPAPAADADADGGTRATVLSEVAAEAEPEPDVEPENDPEGFVQEDYGSDYGEDYYEEPEPPVFHNPVAAAILDGDRGDDPAEADAPDSWYDSVDDVPYDEIDDVRYEDEPDAESDADDAW